MGIGLTVKLPPGHLLVLRREVELSNETEGPWKCLSNMLNYV
jgi:hypothetical protein